MSKTTRPIRVLIVDDHPTTRAGIRTVLEKAPDIKVVGEAQNGTEAQQLVAELYPQILLLDLQMPGLRASEVEVWVREHYPETITLVLTAHDRDAYLSKMIDVGVTGYLLKEKKTERLVQAIRCAARGEILITGGQLARAHRWRKKVGERWESLTDRERQVLRLLTQGSDNASIAKTLNVSVNTVRCHVGHVYAKLKVANRMEAVAFVLRHKLLEPEI